MRAVQFLQHCWMPLSISFLLTLTLLLIPQSYLLHAPACDAQATGEVEHTAADAAADERISSLYNNLVGMGLLRR